jgi:uncharacterized protein (DUF983 family)
MNPFSIFSIACVVIAIVAGVAMYFTQFDEAMWIGMAGWVPLTLGYIAHEAKEAYVKWLAFKTQSRQEP